MSSFYVQGYTNYSYVYTEPCVCILCVREAPLCLTSRSPHWKRIVHVVLFVLHRKHSSLDYFNVKNHIYPFVKAHWERLALEKKETDRWQKQILDALAHGVGVFRSGQKVLYHTGYWRLCNVNDDPWLTMRPVSDYSHYDVNGFGRRRAKVSTRRRRQVVDLCEDEVPSPNDSPPSSPSSLSISPFQVPLTASRPSAYSISFIIN